MFIVGIVCSVILGIKVIWNISVPYTLLYRARTGNGVGVSISLVPIVDAILLMLIAVAGLVAARWWLPIVSLCSVSVSYVHLVVMVRVLRPVVAHALREHSQENSSSSRIQP